MKLKSSALFPAALIAQFALGGASGCSTRGPASRTATNPHRVPTYALSVAVRGGIEPTPAQWNALYAKFDQSLAARGLLLINDYSLADHLINLEFLPDPLNPNVGTAVVSSIIPNTAAYIRNANLAGSIYPATYTTSANRGYDPFWSSTSSYDRYNSYDYAGYGYSSYTPPVSTGSTTPVKPPTTPPPTHPADCPPGTYQRPPDYVSNHPSRHVPPHGGPTPPLSYSPSPRPEPSSSNSRYSSSGSSESSSYSPPSNSSSSSSAPSYSPAAESSSSSSYSSGRDSGANKQPN